MSVCSVSALFAGSLTTGGQIGLLLLWGTVYSGLMISINLHEKKNTPS